MLNRQIRRHTIVEQAMDRIRDLISSGEFKIGEKFPNESALAERFGIGRSSIREVIKILHYMGVLHSSTGRGTYILDWRNISIEALTWTSLLCENDHYELMDVRFTIENRCIRSLVQEYAMGKADAARVIGRLEETAEKLRMAAEGNDAQTLIEADYEFHSLVIQSHRNSVFSSIYEILRSFMIDATRDMLNQYEDRMQIYREHREIIDSIKSGDPDIVSAHCRDHIENAKTLIGKSLN